MGAILYPTANSMAADIAGNTSSQVAVPTAAPAQISEILSGIGSEYGGLSHLFGTGINPVSTNLAQATDSTVGRMGGLVPAIRSVVAPGPGTLDNDGDNDHGVPDLTLPGQVADNVAAQPGGYSSAQAGTYVPAGTAAVAGMVATVRRFFGGN